MSRVGLRPVPVPDGVTVDLVDGGITVKGSKGSLSAALFEEVETTRDGDQLVFAPANDTARAQSLWGTQRTLVDNMVTGVTEGFTRRLQINGVGYRANLQGKDLRLQLGFSHDVVFPVPDGIEIECPTQTEIIISGIDRQQVGQVASEIRAYRPPEPYKGKGIKYAEENIFRKEGKKK